MRSASHLFYLAAFSLLAPSHASSDSESPPVTKSLNSNPNVCAFEPSATVSDACASYNTLDEINEAIHPHLKALTRKTDFFSYYRLNLYNKACPFWDDGNGMCGNIACAVNTLENESDIPEIWRAHQLGRLQGRKASHPDRKMRALRKAAGSGGLAGELGSEVAESCIMEPEDEDCDEKDYCVLEDEADLATGGDYVSLIENQEKFTGYAGPGASQVWEAIYRENCFSKPTDIDASSEQSQAPPLGGLGSGIAAQRGLRSMQQKQEIKNVISSGGSKQSLDALITFDDTCLEKRVFHRVVSGMHASISTHLCWDYLNQSNGFWAPNLACYEERLHNHPERLSNLYFNYALLLRAVRKARTHVQTYSYCSTDPREDIRTKDMVLALADALPAGKEIFDESTMFQSADYDPVRGLTLKEDFRARFRNVSRIMDCVGCDKCRLWGKLQTQGYGTALKVLFEFDEDDSSKDPPLRRTELVSLVNTLNRVSHSLAAVKQFEGMIETREMAKRGGLGNIPVEAFVMPTPAGQGDPFQTAQVSLRAPPESLPPIEDDGYPEFLRPENRKYKPDMSIAEVLAEEMRIIYLTTKFILNQWVSMPGKLTKIATLEAGRLWDYWLGVPVGPPSFRWRQFPKNERHRPDEL